MPDTTDMTRYDRLDRLAEFHGLNIRPFDGYQVTNALGAPVGPPMTLDDLETAFADATIQFHKALTTRKEN